MARWTEEMLDQLADDVKELKDTTQEMQLAITRATHNLNMMMGAINALAERDEKRQEEFKQYKEEFDRRMDEQNKRMEEQNKRIEDGFKESHKLFYTLLDEIRYMNRRNQDNQNPT